MPAPDYKTGLKNRTCKQAFNDDEKSFARLAPELSPGPGVLVVGRDEAENVFVPKHHRLILTL
jgi:hypothetical protein